MPSSVSRRSVSAWWHELLTGATDRPGDVQTALDGGAGRCPGETVWGGVALKQPAGCDATVLTRAGRPCLPERRQPAAAALIHLMLALPGDYLAPAYGRLSRLYLSAVGPVAQVVRAHA